MAMAYLEKAVYCGEKRFTEWDVGQSVTKGPKVDLKQLRFVTSSNTQAAAGVGKMLQPRGCFVAVRGTYGPISSLLDAAFWLTDFEHGICPGCQVVQGFHLAYLSIKDGIFRALEEFQCQQEPLYLVGHSQGAASLTYFMFDALVKNYTVQHMYALESPRPGAVAKDIYSHGSMTRAYSLHPLRAEGCFLAPWFRMPSHLPGRQCAVWTSPQGTRWQR